MLPRRMSRRTFLAALGGGASVAVLLGSCIKTGTLSAPPTLPANPTIADLKRGAAEISVLTPNTPVNPGPQDLSFALTTTGQQLVTAGSPEVWLAPDPSSPATGPLTATWYKFTGYDKTGDRSPRSDLPGAFVVRVDPPSAAFWAVVVRGMFGSQLSVGVATLPVTDQHIVAAVGSKAISTPSPVATSKAKIAEICTRNPVCPMHYVSLVDGLKNGKPTVVSFATPLLCETRLCGPVVDEQILVFEKVRKERANFIHVEEFLPGPDLQPPSAIAKNLSPAFKAWGFQSEPWVIVIDGKGTIRERLGPGAVMAPEIEAVLGPLL